MPTQQARTGRSRARTQAARSSNFISELPVGGPIDLARQHSSSASALAAQDSCCDPVACVAPVLHHSSRRALRSHSRVPLRGAAAAVRSLICARRRPRWPDIARPGHAARAGAPAVNAHPLPSLVSRPVVLELFGRPILQDRPKPSAATRCGHGRAAWRGRARVRRSLCWGRRGPAASRPATSSGSGCRAFPTVCAGAESRPRCR